MLKNSYTQRGSSSSDSSLTREKLRVLLRILWFVPSQQGDRAAPQDSL